ncbi:hypothetical protein DFH29DRAFT_1000886 [Suillus ampliporus]|nr:hypothetical protein DFH29DRAFT_1000886 [Suillus ampliporus]
MVSIPALALTLPLSTPAFLRRPPLSRSPSPLLRSLSLPLTLSPHSHPTCSLSPPSLSPLPSPWFSGNALMSLACEDFNLFWIWRGSQLERDFSV